MPRTPGLAIGPMDVDSAGDLVGRLGVHNKADRLLNRHRQMYPLELQQKLALPRDEDRSAALAEVGLEEIEEALLAIEGRRAFFRDGYVLEDASVKGDTPSNRVISVVFRTSDDPMARSGRGTLPYDSVPAIERAYDELQAEKTAGRAGEARQAARERAASAESVEAAFEDRLREIEREVRSSEESRKALEEELERLRDPEPYEGYAEANAEAIIARVSDNGRDEFGKSGLERMAEYEGSHKNRSTVLGAIDAELSKPAPGEG